MFNYADMARYSYQSMRSPVNDDIIDIWDYNFLDEMNRLSQLVDEYPIISFVSLYCDPLGSFLYSV